MFPNVLLESEEGAAGGGVAAVSENVLWDQLELGVALSGDAEHQPQGV